MLFLERARAVGRLDELDGPTAEAVAQLCRRLDGLPLALELAAARTRILPPATILRHLEAQTSGLLEKAGDDDRRHGSLDAVLTWSLDLLEDNEAEVLGAVAICPGGFDLAIADALAPDRRVIQALDVLATHGLLVERAEVDGEPWYQLLETIRVAALQRTSARAYAAHWLRLSTYLPQRLEGTFEAYYQLDEVAFRRADATLDDIRAVLDWTTPNDPGLNLSLAARFWPYWYVRGRSREGLARLRSAIAANPDASSDLARGLLGLAVLSRNAGLSEVRKIGAEAARIAKITGDVAIEIGGLTQIVMAADAPTEGVSDRLRELLPSLSDPVSRYLCLSALAVADAQETPAQSNELIARLREAQDAVAGTSYRRLQGQVAAESRSGVSLCRPPSRRFRTILACLIGDRRDCGHRLDPLDSRHCGSVNRPVQRCHDLTALGSGTRGPRSFRQGRR